MRFRKFTSLSIHCRWGCAKERPARPTPSRCRSTRRAKSSTTPLRASVTPRTRWVTQTRDRAHAHAHARAHTHTHTHTHRGNTDRSLDSCDGVHLDCSLSSRCEIYSLVENKKLRNLLLKLPINHLFAALPCLVKRKFEQGFLVTGCAQQVRGLASQGDGRG